MPRRPGPQPATPTASGPMIHQQPFSPQHSQRGGPKSTVSKAFSCSFCRWLRSVIFSTVPVMVVLVTASLLKQRGGTQFPATKTRRVTGRITHLLQEHFHVLVIGDSSPLHSRTQSPYQWFSTGSKEGHITFTENVPLSAHVHHLQRMLLSEDYPSVTIPTPNCKFSVVFLLPGIIHYTPVPILPPFVNAFSCPTQLQTPCHMTQ